MNDSGNAVLVFGFDRDAVTAVTDRDDVILKIDPAGTVNKGIQGRRILWRFGRVEA